MSEHGKSRKGSTRDGLFQRRGWWWLDYYDAEGKRHRKKAAPDQHGMDARQAQIVQKRLETGNAVPGLGITDVDFNGH